MDVRQELLRRFAAPLPEYYTRRIVVFEDDQGGFAADVEQMELPGVHPLEAQRAPKPAQTPFQPRSGIKPAVSEILNEGECGCPKREIDPRLSALADLLKD